MCNYYRNLTYDRVANIFGPEFSDELKKKTETGIIAPVSSKYGYHIVEVLSLIPEKQRTFEEVKSQIIQQLELARNQKSFDTFYKQVKQDYTIVVEGENRD